MSDEQNARSVARLQLVSAHRTERLEDLRIAISETMREMIEGENEQLDKVMLRLASDFLAGRFGGVASKQLALTIERLSYCVKSAKSLRAAEDSVARLQDELRQNARLLGNIVLRN